MDTRFRAESIPSLNAMVSSHARVKPSADAIVTPERIISFGEFEARIIASADQLSVHGVTKWSRVGVALGETSAHLVLLFAIGRLGAVAVPLDKRWTVSEKQKVASAFHADVVLIDDDEEDLSPLSVVQVSKDWTHGQPSTTGKRQEQPGPHDPFIFSLSSGTTGSPTGPALSQAQLFHRFVNQWITLRLNGGDRFLAATPLYFGATRSFCLSILCAGGTVILSTPGMAIEDLVRLLVDSKATATFLVPTLLRRLLALDDASLAPLQQLRVLISSGAVLHDDERDEVRRRICPSLFNYYGTTEGGGISILTPEDAVAGAGSVGRAAFLVDIETVDRNGVPVPDGEVGRLRYRGPGVAGGPIYGADDIVESNEDGWFYPGDLASIRDDGFVFLRGRDKEMIMRGGVNVYPVEIEAEISQLDSVIDVAVAGYPSREFGEEVAAFVVAQPALTEATVMAHCRSKLAPYKIPSRIIFCGSFPRSESGKIRKQDLVKMHIS